MADLDPYPVPEKQLNRKEKKMQKVYVITRGEYSDYHIEKMIRDRVAKWKAEQNGLC